MPTLMDRDPWETWVAGGGEMMLDRVRARVRTVLDTHTSPPLPEGAEERIAAILAAAEEREGVAGWGRS
jgi:trimethylamine:corrinoid methyltransferase-like protein